MSKKTRIRTPLALWVSRLQTRVIPIVVFAASGIAGVWMLKDYTARVTVVGEVEAVRTEAVSAANGTIKSFAAPQLELYQRVEADQVIARLDDSLLVASIETLRAELSRLKAEPEALVEKTHHEQTEFTHDHAIETRRLATRIEVLRVQLLDQQAQRESSRVQLQHEQIRYDETKKLIAGGLDTKVALLPIVARRDLLQKQVELFGKTIEEMEGQRSKAEATLKDFPQPVRADVDKMLAPLRAAIDAQDARIRALQLETSKLEIRVPISGRIVAIHKRPGQAVRAGDPIVTIAAESGSYIVAHLRENQNQNVKAGVPVEIRPRSSMNVVSKSVVVRIGPQISEVPSHQRRDASRPEWGLPVRIAVPPDVKLRPGELVDLNFDFPKAQSSS